MVELLEAIQGLGDPAALERRFLGTGLPLPLTLAGPAAPVAGPPGPARPDQVLLSPEALSQVQGQGGDPLTTGLWNALIERDARTVLALKQQGQTADLQAARDTLFNDYSAARRLGIPLNPEVEQLVALATDGQLGGQGQNGLGIPPVGGSNGLGAPPVAGGRGGVPLGGGGLGGAPVGGGGGLPPFGGGGGGQGGGGTGGARGFRGKGLGEGGPGGSTLRENFRPWSEQDRQFLNQALISEPEHFRNLFSGFAQGREGNCASIAVMKAAMDRYDNRVFDEVRRSGDGYAIRMQDGFQLNLSDRELALARAHSHFTGNDPTTRSYAELLWGAMARRSQLERGGSYAQNLHRLNNGEDPNYAAHLLGLGHQRIPVNPRTLNGQDSVVAWNHSHAIFVNRERDGRHVADHYGQPTPYTGTDTNGRAIHSAFTFRPRPYPRETRRVEGNRSAGAARGPAPRPSSPPRRTTTVRRS